MKNLATVLAVVGFAAFANLAPADWDPEDPYKMHFPQLPNLEDGMDIRAGPWANPGGVAFYEKFLADDWVCTQSGYVTDIHIWSSYNEDLRLMEVPAFSLVIYDNIPATADTPSMPGKALWESENFYDPNVGDVVGWDTEVWQYNFIFEDVANLFYQEEGKTYWLGLKHTFDLDGSGMVDFIDLSMLIEMSPAAFGWKTADVRQYPPPNTGQHFMDDAVWIDVTTLMVPTGPHIVPESDVWNELYDPFTGKSLDLSFVITPEPGTVLLLGAGAVGLLIRRRRRQAPNGAS